MAGGIVGSAFVQVEPIVTGFRQKVATGVTRSLGTIAVPVPVSPVVAPGALKSSTQLGESFLKTSAGASALRASMLGLGAGTGATIIGFTALGAGLFTFLGAARAAITSAADLQTQLNVFRVVARASADDMGDVSDEAKRLGADLSLPAVSANDAALAMTELAKAGLTVRDSIDAARGTLQFAAAAQLDVASSAELVASALNAFQLAGRDAADVGNLLAGAANAAQGSMGDFGLALSQSAAVAHQAGLSIADTTVLLTELARAGIQGSDAGTSLRVSLLRLVAPTNQARKIFNELGIQVTDALGNVRTDVFEQLRVSMLRLEPATRNATLAILFGTDAVRAASVFTREGAAGFDRLTKQVTRAGQASDIAGARAKGFGGAVSGLQSNLETLGTSLGTVTLGPLTEFVKGLSSLASLANLSANAISDLGEKIGDLPGAGKLGDFAKNIARSLPPFALFDVAGAAVERFGSDVEDGADKASQGIARLSRVPGDELKKIGGELSLIGQLAGKNWAQGISKGIASEQHAAVTEARRTLAQVIAEGRRMVADAIRAGDLAVEAAAFDAKRNLIQIGGDLASLASQFIDTGPLGQRIKALQASLDISQTGLERNRLRRALRDAQQELDQAEQQIALRPGQRLTAQQKAGVQQFLTPFREKVKDAQAALQEFSTEGIIAKLQKQADQEKRVVQRGLDDLIARFNAGQLSLDALNKRAIALLRQNIPGFGKVGQQQGFAFRQQWMAELRALQEQSRQIVIGPRTTRVGVEPSVVSPAAASAQARKDVQDAVRAANERQRQATIQVKDAIDAAKEAEQKALTGKGGTNDLLRQIHQQLGRGQGGTQSTVPRSTRRGPR